MIFPGSLVWKKKPRLVDTKFFLCCYGFPATPRRKGGEGGVVSVPNLVFSIKQNIKIEKFSLFEWVEGRGGGKVSAFSSITMIHGQLKREE